MTAAPQRPDPAYGGKVLLSDLTPSEIAEAVGLKPFQGAQIFRWLHRKGVFDFQAMTDLSKAVRQQLEATCVARQLTLLDCVAAPGRGAKKALYKLEDRGRVTVCVSSQVGCE